MKGHPHCLSLSAAKRVVKVGLRLRITANGGNSQKAVEVVTTANTGFCAVPVDKIGSINQHKEVLDIRWPLARDFRWLDEWTFEFFPGMDNSQLFKVIYIP